MFDIEIVLRGGQTTMPLKDRPLSNRGMVDIHSHILPGLDDGARDMEEALAMADVATKDGITILVATPHVIKGVCDNQKPDILTNVGALNKSLRNNGNPLLILPGAEYHLDPGLPQQLADGKLLTINNTPYLLVELPNVLMSEITERILYEIQLQAVTPIIAHPERNHTLAQRPELLKAYLDRGCLAQVTSGSITGLFGRRVTRTAEQFLQAGWIHVIASDSHSAQGRAPQLSKAIAVIEQRWGKPYAQALAGDNPHFIINGQPLPPIQPPPKQSLWNKLWHRIR